MPGAGANRRPSCLGNRQQWQHKTFLDNRQRAHPLAADIARVPLIRFCATPGDKPSSAHSQFARARPLGVGEKTSVLSKLHTGSAAFAPALANHLPQ